MPQSIRYANVGSTTIGSSPDLYHFDLVVTARSPYSTASPSLNGISGQFAQINFACAVGGETSFDLRVQVFPSCVQGASCTACEDAASDAERDACYAAGCSCFGSECPAGSERSCCTGAARESKRLAYDCASADAAFVLPGNALVGMSIFDLDTGDGSYVEEVVASGYQYFVAPLRAASGNAALSSRIAADRSTGTFTATATGSSVDNPTDPFALTDEQAAKGMQLFFKPEDGHVDMTFKVRHDGTGGTCTGRNLLFSGDSHLCNPPPPMPPVLPPPPSPPPPSPPPPPAQPSRSPPPYMCMHMLRVL